MLAPIFNQEWCPWACGMKYGQSILESQYMFLFLSKYPWQCFHLSNLSQKEGSLINLQSLEDGKPGKLRIEKVWPCKLCPWPYFGIIWGMSETTSGAYCQKLTTMDDNLRYYMHLWCRFFYMGGFPKLFTKHFCLFPSLTYGRVLMWNCRTHATLGEDFQAPPTPSIVLHRYSIV